MLPSFLIILWNCSPDQLIDFKQSYAGMQKNAYYLQACIFFASCRRSNLICMLPSVQHVYSIYFSTHMYVILDFLKIYFNYVESRKKSMKGLYLSWPNLTKNISFLIDFWALPNFKSFILSIFQTLLKNNLMK